MMRGGRTKTRTAGRARGPVRGTRKNVRRAKRAAVIVGAATARKRATAARGRRAADMAESQPKAAKTPRKPRIGKR
jgi:hypothetical protein